MKHLWSILKVLVVALIFACIYTGNIEAALTGGGIVYLIAMVFFIIVGTGGLIVTIWKGSQDENMSAGEIVSIVASCVTAIIVGVGMLLIPALG